MMSDKKIYNFQYQKYGDVVAFKEKDWITIVKFLERNGVTVSEKDTRTKRPSRKPKRKDAKTK